MVEEHHHVRWLAGLQPKLSQQQRHLVNLLVNAKGAQHYSCALFFSLSCFSPHFNSLWALIMGVALCASPTKNVQKKLVS
jgi:hypothetical protein